MLDHLIHYVHVYENKPDQQQCLYETDHDIQMLIEQLEQFPKLP